MRPIGSSRSAKEWRPAFPVFTHAAIVQASTVSSIGIWSQAVEMGKVAGACAAGEEVIYQPITPSNAFNGMGTALFSVGDPGRDPERKYKSIEMLDAGKGTYEKLYFTNNRFCGGILLGDVSKAPKFIEAYKNQESIEKLL